MQVLFRTASPCLPNMTFPGHGFRRTKRPHSLFTMFDIDAAHGAEHTQGQTLIFLSGVPQQPKPWWRRTGSNRRPDACKATALPAELRPLILVGLGRLERPTSPLSGVRSNHLSYRPRAGADRQPLRAQRRASDPAIRMRKRNEGGLSRSRQMRP